MRFSENGYYVESYVKCDNCGVLIYDEGIERDTQRFCTHWCAEWKAQKAAGKNTPEVAMKFDQ